MIAAAPRRARRRVGREEFAMICPGCGATIRSDATVCPFCQASTTAPRPASPPPAPQVPPAPLPLQASPPPVGSPPVGSPPLAPASGRPVPLLPLALAGCFALLVIGGLGGYFAWRTLSGQQRPALTADSAKPPDDAATGTSPSSAAAPAEPGPGLNLDDFVGTWSFVGEPGPWGEGWPFRLERNGNLLVGEVEVPERYDDRIQLEFSAGNGEVVGESRVIYHNDAPHANAVRMLLETNQSIMTVKYRADSGEWLTSVAHRQGGAAPGASSSSDTTEADLRALVVRASGLTPPADGVVMEIAGDWVFADVAEKDNQGNWATATSVIARRQSGQWQVVMVGDPSEHRALTSQMSAEVRRAYDKWDAGHY